MKSDTPLNRFSNIELLRIIAMFMVLIVHADFIALSIPIREDFGSEPITSTVKIFFEAFGIFGVNIFVGISGWFTIKPSLIRCCKFLFQCLFFSIGLFIICFLIGLSEFNMEALENLILLRSYWFVISYLGLFILSPLLNSFIEHSSEKIIRYFLITFYLFQTIYTKDNAASFINQGYSTFSFIGIYIFANYSKKYVFNKLSIYKIGNIVGLCVFSNFIMGLIGSIFNQSIFMSFLMNYCNPVTVIGAIFIIMLFAKLNIKHNRIINYVSASSFSVYLFHSFPVIFSLYCDIIRNLFSNYNGFICFILIFAFLVSVYLASILFDLARKFLWNLISCNLRYKLSLNINI